MPAKDSKVRAATQKAYRERQKQQRGTPHKNWMFVFYEDQDPEWRDDIEDTGIPVVVSPLHDRDTWSAADQKKNPSHKQGALKVEHRHGVASYPTAVYYDQVLEDFSFLKTKNVKYVKSLAAMARYLVHMDSPDKAQYDPEGIVEFNSADWRDWCATGTEAAKEIPKMRAEILRRAREEGAWTVELALFWNWCDANNEDWSRLLDTVCSSTVERFTTRLRGLIEHGDARALAELGIEPEGMRDAEWRVIDDETGELLATFAECDAAQDYVSYLATCDHVAHVLEGRSGMIID